MREFSSFAAWSYAQHVEDKLAVMLRESLGAVNHGENMHMNPPVPRARELAHYLPFDSRCNCHRNRFGPNPSALFAFRLGDGFLDVATNSHPDPMEGWEVDRAPAEILPAGAYPDYTAADERWIIDTIARRTRSTSTPERGFTLVVGRRVIGYTLMPTAWGDTMVYGAEYRRESLVDVMSTVLETKGLLPATFTDSNSNRDVIVARVTDRTGAPLFDSAPGEVSPYQSRVEMNPSLGALAVRVSVRPQQASVLVIGGLPKSHLPFLLGVLALAAALSVVAVIQLKRETELARMRSDFVANVSHELRTPLAQIRMFGETLLLNRVRSPEERRRSLEIVVQESQRLTQLIENVLQFSRRDGGSTRVSLKEERLDVLLHDIVDAFEPLARSRRATIVRKIDAGVVAPVDAGALRQIVLNLLDNALKYGPAGQTIIVGCRCDADVAAISIEDEGPGVSAGDAGRIWDAFYRSAQTGGASGGTGIGLAIVKRLTEMQGGAVRVEPGSRGARFVVEFRGARRQPGSDPVRVASLGA